MHIHRYIHLHMNTGKITVHSIASGTGTRTIILAGSMQLFTKTGDLQTEANNIFLHDQT